MRPAQPAVLFGGDFVSCAVWAVAPDGSVQNLGGIANLSDKGTAVYSFAKRSFALMITAEPIVTVRNPSDIVFTAGTPADKSVQPTRFSFSGLEPRAAAVRTFLTEMGIQLQRIMARGYGSNQPIAPNDTAEGRAKNRRVDILLTETR